MHLVGREPTVSTVISSCVFITFHYIGLYKGYYRGSFFYVLELYYNFTIRELFYYVNTSTR